MKIPNCIAKVFFADLRTNWIALVLALECLVVALVSITVSSQVYEGVPHLEDEHAYLFQAKVFSKGRLVAPSPPAHMFPIPFVIDLDEKRFSKYTPGYSLLLASGVLAGWIELVNVVAGIIVVVMMYLVARELGSPRTGLIAAGLFIVSPLAAIQLGTIMPHASTMAAIMVFAFAMLRLRRPEEPHALAYSVLAGASFGIALISRPLTTVALGLPFCLAGTVWLSRAPRAWVPRVAVATLSFVSVAAIWPLYNYAATGKIFINTYRLWWDYDGLGFGPGFGRLPGGHTLESAIVNLRHHGMLALDVATPLPAKLAQWSLLVLLMLALVRPSFPRQWVLFFVSVVGSLVLAYFCYWVGAARYYSEALPFVFLIAGAGLNALFTLRRVRWIAAAAVPGALMWGLYTHAAPLVMRDKGLYSITRADSDKMERAGLDNALVLVKTISWTDFGRLSFKNSPFLDSGTIYAVDHGDAATKAFPDRSVYKYDPRSGELTRVSGR